MKKLKGCNGILIPGGFGIRGINGKINAIKYARENNIPFLGICLGMQSAVIEFTRNVIGIKDANSTEMNPQTSAPVINLMQEQEKITDKGGTMRLGAYKCKVKINSNSYKAYKEEIIYERHRHRYEVNNNYLDMLISCGMTVAGRSKDKSLVEVIELRIILGLSAVNSIPNLLLIPEKVIHCFQVL